MSLDSSSSENTTFEIPDDFYCPVTIDKEILTSTSTSRFSIPQLVQGNPEFWIAGEQRQLKPKRIVLKRDAAFIEKIMRTNYYEFLQHLLDQGFELYFYDKKSNPNTLQKIPSDNLWSCMNSGSTQLNAAADDETPKNFTRVLQKEGFSDDETLILTDEKIKVIYKIKEYDLIRKVEFSEDKKTNDYFKNRYLFLSCFMNGINATVLISQIKEHVKTIQNSTQKNEFETRMPEAIKKCQRFFDEMLPNLVDLSIANLKDFTLPTMDRLQNLDVFRCTEELVIHFLNVAKNTKKLTLNHINSENAYTTSENFSFPNLEELVINGGVSFSFLMFILARTNNLKKLVFSKNMSSDELCIYKPLLENEEFRHYRHLLSEESKKAIEQATPEDYFFNALMASNSSSSKSLSAPAPRTADYNQTSEKGDLDTTPTDISYNVERLFYAKKGFYHPPIHSYRLQVYPKDLQFKEDGYERQRDKPIPLPLKENPIFETSADILIEKRNHANNQFYAQYPLSKSRDWQPLPSLSPQEKITSIFTEGEKDSITLHYCKEENLYYVKNNTDKALDLHFNVDVPVEELKWPNEISKLITFIQGFKVGELEKKEGTRYDGKALLNEIIKQQVGACRHRAAAFKYLMKKRFPHYPVRLITNDVHEYVEIQFNGEWVTCNLGGYPAKLNIHDKKEPEPKQKLESTLARSKEGEQTPNPFMRWEQSDIRFDLLLSFNLKMLFHSKRSNFLIELPNKQTLDYQFTLQELCHHLQQPVYYIHSPKDLMCHSNWIEYQKDGSGVLKKGPGGTLYDFLKQNENNAPLIIVNWNNFSPEDITKFNSLIDKERLADGVPLPPNTHVIGLYDTASPTAYQGSDFFSRFSKQYAFPHSIDLEKAPTLSSAEKNSLSKETVSIDLYESSQWETLLLGRWIMQGDSLHYKDGPLLEAIRDNKPVHIVNPPDSESFKLFMQKMILDGAITVPGRTIPIPGKWIPTLGKGYDWDKKNKQIVWKPIQAEGTEIITLNPTSFYTFFSDFELKEHKIYECPGWLEKNKGKTIPIEITKNLSESQWSHLLDTAAKWNVTLQIHPKENLLLPKGMRAPSKEILQKSKPLAYSQVILSSDPDYSANKLKEDYSSARIIDISEHTTSDILSGITHEKTIFEQESRFHFTEHKSKILKKLEKGENFILKGNFSPELLDSLAPFILSTSKLPGKLFLVTSQAESVHSIPHTVSNPTPQEKLEAFELLSNTHSKAFSTMKSAGAFEHYSYTQLETILKFLEKNPSARPEDAWLDFHTLPSVKDNASILEKPDLNLSLKACQDFEEARLNKIRMALSKEPYVFISGPTGSGKSTFIHDVLKKNGYTIYNEQSDIEDWANDKSDTLKVLFIDEANIGASQYTNFEGLFDNPPWILCNQKLIKLSPLHKVIFAGNPASYGGRHLPTLFEQHANSIVFDALSPAYLYHNVLEPIFSERNIDTALKNKLLTIFLKTYQKIQSMSPDKILMSPRELQMMALLTLSMDNPANYLAKAYEVARDFSLSTLPIEHKSDFDTWFNQTFLNIPPLKHPNFEAQLEDFILTPSRYKAYLQMEDLLRVREYQQKSNTSHAQYGGLGGIVFEAEPGVGKSDFVIKMLKKHGFRKATLGKEAVSEEEKLFYHIPASLSKTEKEELLLKAFHEGAIVVMDEMNSNGMLEKIMNALLMGRDLQGNRPKKPGFKIIGTENPITYAGRKARSIAFQRRLMTGYFPEYPANELSGIIVEKGLSKSRASILVEHYFYAKKYALQHNKKPIPSPRMLLDITDALLKAQERKTLPEKLREKEKEEEKQAHVPEKSKEKSENKRQTAVRFSRIVTPFLASPPSSVLSSLPDDTMREIKNLFPQKKYGTLDILFGNNLNTLQWALTEKQCKELIKLYSTEQEDPFTFALETLKKEMEKFHPDEAISGPISPKK